MSNHIKKKRGMVASKPLPQAARSEMAASMAAIKAQGCFRCDGTKELCNVCGESARACECPEEEQSFYECPDCKSPNEKGQARREQPGT